MTKPTTKKSTLAATPARLKAMRAATATGGWSPFGAAAWQLCNRLQAAGLIIRAYQPGVSYLATPTGLKWLAKAEKRP